MSTMAKTVIPVQVHQRTQDLLREWSQRALAAKQEHEHARLVVATILQVAVPFAEPADILFDANAMQVSVVVDAAQEEAEGEEKECKHDEG